MNIPQSLIDEFEAYATDKINDGILTMDNQDEWHHLLFNEDYYIVGYWKASQWMATHGYDPFEAIQICLDYERDAFGESDVRSYDNSESTANMLAYVLGEEWLNESGNEFITDAMAAGEVAQ